MGWSIGTVCCGATSWIDSIADLLDTPGEGVRRDGHAGGLVYLQSNESEMGMSTVTASPAMAVTMRSSFDCRPTAIQVSSTPFAHHVVHAHEVDPGSR